MPAKEPKSTAKKKLKITVLSGAGISAESGIATFRGNGGLWEGLDVRKVASPEGWNEDYQMVLDFYNQRRRAIGKVEPNQAHIDLALLQELHRVEIVTQNIDDLHEKGGSQNVLHLHGEITKGCSSNDKGSIVSIGYNDILPGMLAKDGSQLRPFIVWFGEQVPKMIEAINRVEEADVILIIGTSMEVYPAAGLINYANSDASIFVIDPSDLKHKIPSGLGVTQIK
mgnify:CR=1 FL=1